MSLKDVFSLTLPQQKIAVSWFNDYSGVVIKSPNTTIIFDPVDIKPEDVLNADVIVITHEHYDHCSVKDINNGQRWKQFENTILYDTLQNIVNNGMRKGTLRFIDDDGITELSYEVEKWNSSGDSYIWVKVPLIENTSSTGNKKSLSVSLLLF